MNVKQTNPLVGILIGCGAVFGIGCIAMCGGVVWLASGPESGVKLSNNMDEYATKYLEENSILNGSESLLAYYDVTLSMDGSEAAILTDERVIYHKNGNTTAIELKDIADIRDRDEGMIGHVIDIENRVGAPMTIEIAPWNGGPTFVSALRGAWEKTK